jgi:BirA family biotin operon repressor/biotin-[acetyl-CoA-carboxylase] ligase
VLPLTAGVAVAQALQESGVRARLKWPNDVRVGGRKIAGLLAEMVPGARVVLGVGVNVAPLDAVWPEVRAERATSLEAEIGRGLDRLAVCAAVLARLAVCYDALATGGTAAMLDLWRALAEPWWGRPVEWRAGGRAGRGIARGVDGQGALIVEREDGLRESLLSGDVHELRLSGEASSA